MARAELCTEDIASLKEDLRIEPDINASRAADAGDLRYLMWSGLYSIVPGIKNQECIREGRYSKWFRGTSDAICSSAHEALYKRSYAYAEAYNRTMARLRASKNVPTCD
jgi:hypothetical protein